MKKDIFNCSSYEKIKEGMMGKFIKIDNQDIEAVLKKVSRQYLVGNLKQPQELTFVKDENIEVGITDYNVYSTEPVHYHTQAVEYQYMLSGWTQYMDIETGEIFEFKKGDFYVIERNIKYAQKSKSGTRILFIKVPSVNDKQVVDTGEKILTWYKEGLGTIRKDYSHEKTMPKANAMKPAAAVAIVRDNKILMLKRIDNGKWTLPGGTMELNESLIDCAVREVREETGLNIKVTDIIGTYTDPEIRIEYSDGEVRREFTIVYYGTVDVSNVILDEESSSYDWISIDTIDEYSMTSSQRRRIADVIEYIKTGNKRIG